MTELVPVKRALITVSDKADLIPFAKNLISYGVSIISTGGTANKIRQAGLEVTAIDQVTGFPEMMDGRLKTLHPRVHGGLLALRDNDEHLAQMSKHAIEPIDLVCVNLYPFEQTASRPDVADSDVIEQIDIGGPSMLRSAAKNHRFVTVVTDPGQYDTVIAEMAAHDGATTLALRQKFALAAFTRTAMYDTAISQWFSVRSGQEKAEFSDSFALRFSRHGDPLRYGENPHQSAALYVDPSSTEPSAAHAKKLHGIPLGYCNLLDADGALELVKEIDPVQLAAAAVIKHANPCGFAVSTDLAQAFEKAYAGDPLAAFGGIVAMNRKVDMATAEAICAGKKFLHVVIAPGYDKQALERLTDRWKDVRILEVGDLLNPAKRSSRHMALRQITGGLLVQQRDLAPFDQQPTDWKHVGGPEPTQVDLQQLALAMISVKHLKSNAVCLVNDGSLVGAGAGQMDRLASTRLAIENAGGRAKGSVAASDAFFPFRDGPDLLIEAGVKAMVQPGGSKKDEDTIAACHGAGVTLVFTGRRHFRH